MDPKGEFMKKTLLMALTGLLLLTACTSKTEEKVLKIGTLAAEGALPIIMAQEEGYFEEFNVKVEIIPFANPQDRNAAAQAKEIDGMIADAMSAFTFQEKGLNYLITSDINEDFIILSSPDSNITSMKDMNEKSVALIPGLILEYIMDVIAEEEAFKYELLVMPSFSGRFEGLIQNQFDALVFTQPQANALMELGAHRLGSSAEYNIKGGALLFSDQVVMDYSKDLSNFYKAYNKAVDYLNNTKSKDFETVLEKHNFPQGMGHYIDQKESPFTYAQEIDHVQLQAIAQWSKDKGLISNDVDLDKASNYSSIK